MDLLTSAFDDPGFQWNERAARHLLNRAGFGVPPSAVAKLAAMKPADAVSAFVDFEKLPETGAAPDWLPKRPDFATLRQMARTLTEEERKMLRQDAVKTGYEAINRLQIWWLERMCHGQRPLQEKLALFWHGHFATSAEKVREPELNYELNQIFRVEGAGNFRTLTERVGKSGAMLDYLDQNKSNKAKPNENWARELMELFTLGTGNYTENDIKELARAFTGWGARRGGGFEDNRNKHDAGVKTILGKTGPWNGDQGLRIVLDQPACAAWVCRKIWKFFAYDDPEPEVVEGLAKVMRASDYELKPVLRTMFSSRAFHSKKAWAAQIKSPAQLVANLLVQLDAPLDERPPVAQLAMRAMGQSLFSPPNVKGWDGGRAWVNTNTMLVRYNFANYLVSGVVPDFGVTGRGGNQLGKQLAAAFGAKYAGKKNAARKAAAQGEPGEIMMAGGDLTSDNNAMMTAAQTAVDDDAMATTGGAMAGGDGMSGAMAEDGLPRRAAGPVGQDAMAPDNANQTLYGAMKRGKAARAGGMGGAGGPGGGFKPTEESIAMDRAPFRARDFFARYEGMTPEECVRRLALHFVGFALPERVEAELCEALARHGAPGKPLAIAAIPEADLRATVQLLLSTAEYQVC